jgi:hypothetical protein
MAKRHFSSFLLSRSWYLTRKRMVKGLTFDGSVSAARPVPGFGSVAAGDIADFSWVFATVRPS